jgi:hypothetical protein
MRSHSTAIACACLLAALSFLSACSGGAVADKPGTVVTTLLAPVYGIVSDGASLYIAMPEEMVSRFDPGSGVQDLTPRIANAGVPSIAVGPGKLFKTTDAGTIEAWPQSAGGSPTTLVAGESSPHQLSFDGIRLWWVAGQRIRALDPGSSTPRDMFSGNPIALVADATDAFWIDSATGQLVRSANGGSWTAIAPPSGFVTLAAAGDWLWAGGANALRRMRRSGDAQQTVATFAGTIRQVVASGDTVLLWTYQDLASRSGLSSGPRLGEGDALLLRDPASHIPSPHVEIYAVPVAGGDPVLQGTAAISTTAAGRAGSVVYWSERNTLMRPR